MSKTYLIEKEVFNPSKLIGWYVKDEKRIVKTSLEDMYGVNVESKSMISRWLGLLLRPFLIPFRYRKIKTLEEAKKHYSTEYETLEEIQNIPPSIFLNRIEDYVEKSYGSGSYVVKEMETKRKGIRNIAEISTFTYQIIRFTINNK